MGKKRRLRAEYGKKQKGKKVKKLTQDQRDILDLARQVLRLEQAVRDMKVEQTSTAVTVRSLEGRLRGASEALK